MGFRTIHRALPFQLGPGRMTPSKKSGEKKNGHSVIDKVIVTREYTATFTYACMEWVSRSEPLRYSEIQKFAMKNMGTQMCAWTPDSAKLSGPKE